ncbi:hypothetical protein ABZU86_17900 [Streptomyces sp. NPDC005271]
MADHSPRRQETGDLTAGPLQLAGAVVIVALGTPLWQTIRHGGRRRAT